MALEKNVRLCLLNDFYGSLLTQKQQDVLNDYLNYDTSLTEIGELQKTTRQSVLDTIKKASKKLEWYESKLGMVKKYLEQTKLIENSFLLDKQTAKRLLDIWK